VAAQVQGQKSGTLVYNGGKRCIINVSEGRRRTRASFAAQMAKAVREDMENPWSSQGAGQRRGLT